jgi:hypothetical protein
MGAWLTERARQPGKVRRVHPDGRAAALEHLRYVSGDYDDAATFTQVRQQLGAAKHPLPT